PKGTGCQSSGHPTWIDGSRPSRAGRLMRLIEWAQNCGDPQIRADLLTMAEEWLLESMRQPVSAKRPAAPSATWSRGSTRNHHERPERPPGERASKCAAVRAR